jgi:hypothetical protein
MTKKEQAILGELKCQLQAYQALQFAPEVEPDIPPPERGYTFGWLPSGYGTAEVAASGVGVHYRGEADVEAIRKLVAGEYPKGVIGSQRSRRLYSKRSLALRAALREAQYEYIINARRILTAIEIAEEEENAQ